MLTQALLALLGLFGGAWVLLNPNSSRTSPSSLLTSAINFAAAAFLLCDIGMLQSNTTAQLILFEKASTGFTIIVLALLPWALGLPDESKVFLKTHSLLASFFLLTNYLLPISLRYNELTQSDIDPKIVQSDPSLFSLSLLAIATSCAVATAYKAFKIRHETSPKLTSLVLCTAIATALFATMEFFQNPTRPPYDNFMWIAVTLIASTASTAFLRKNRNPPRAAHLVSTPDSTNGEPSESAPAINYEQQALLVRLEENDAFFASKILSSKGYTVMIEDDLSEITDSYFENEKVRYSIIFNRDQNRKLDQCLPRLSPQTAERISFFAITRRRHSPTYLREIRNGHYLTTIESPLKATELFQMLESHNTNDFDWTRSYHHNLS